MIEHLLNATVTVFRATFASDGAGGRTKTMAAAGTLRVKIDQPSAQERLAAGQLGDKLTHVVHAHYGADVARGDELDAGGPRRLRVLAVVNDSRRTYTRVECEVVEGV